MASCPGLDVPPTQISVPRNTLHGLRGDGRDDRTVNMQPSVLAAAPDGCSITIGYVDGRIRYVPLSQALRTKSASSSRPTDHNATSVNFMVTRRSSASATFAPHLSGTAVTSLAYFPTASDQMQKILSAGADGVLHLLNLPSVSPSEVNSAPIPPTCSYKGHFRPVTAAIPLDDGHILSVSRDRSLRLWDAASSSQLRMESLGTGANALAVSSAGGRNTAFIALDSGKVALIDFRQPNTNFTSFSVSDKALTALALLPTSYVLAVGDTRGIVSTYDIRALPYSDTRSQSSFHSFTRGSAEVTSLSFISPTSLAVCTADWLPFVASLESQNNGDATVRVTSEISGAGGGDCAPVRAFTTCAEGGSVWTAGEDGAVRVYVI